MENSPEGIDAVEIYNLHYSGCRLDQHLEWWKSGIAKYGLFKTDNAGRSVVFFKNSCDDEMKLIQYLHGLK